MRENRTCGSEGGEAQSLPYPYRRAQDAARPKGAAGLGEAEDGEGVVAIAGDEGLAAVGADSD